MFGDLFFSVRVRNSAAIFLHVVALFCVFFYWIWIGRLFYLWKIILLNNVLVAEFPTWHFSVKLVKLILRFIFSFCENSKKHFRQGPAYWPCALYEKESCVACHLTSVIGWWGLESFRTALHLKRLLTAFLLHIPSVRPLSPKGTNLPVKLVPNLKPTTAYKWSCVASGKTFTENPFQQSIRSNTVCLPFPLNAHLKVYHYQSIMEN